MHAPLSRFATLPCSARSSLTLGEFAFLRDALLKSETLLLTYLKATSQRMKRTYGCISSASINRLTSFESRGLETNRDDFWSELSITYSRGELAGNPIFAALDPNQKKYLLRGKSPFQQSRYRGKRPLSAIRESAIYTLLSHSAHAYALGLSGFAGYGSATPAGTLNSFLIATQAAQIYLADTARTYCRFRRRALGKLTDKEASLFERCSEPIALNHLLKDIRAGVTK